MGRLRPPSLSLHRAIGGRRHKLAGWHRINLTLRKAPRYSGATPRCVLALAAVQSRQEHGGMKMASSFVLVSFAAVLSVSTVLPAQGQKVVPGQECGNPRIPCDVRLSDPLLMVLLNALRPTVERDLGQPVQFVVRTMRVQGDWAFAIVVPQTKAGGKIDYLKTRHAQRVRAGVFDGSGDVQALLLKESGRWVVKDFAVAPTDVHYAGWPQQFGAPDRLFDLNKPN